MITNEIKLNKLPTFCCKNVIGYNKLIDLFCTVLIYSSIGFMGMKGISSLNPTNISLNISYPMNYVWINSNYRRSFLASHRIALHQKFLQVITMFITTFFISNGKTKDCCALRCVNAYRRKFPENWWVGFEASPQVVYLSPVLIFSLMMKVLIFHVMLYDQNTKLLRHKMHLILSLLLFLAHYHTKQHTVWP